MRASGAKGKLWRSTSQSKCETMQLQIRGTNCGHGLAATRSESMGGISRRVSGVPHSQLPLCRLPAHTLALRGQHSDACHPQLPAPECHCDAGANSLGSNPAAAGEVGGKGSVPGRLARAGFPRFFSVKEATTRKK